MLFLSEETAVAIRSLDEHWDGRGQPDGLAGEQIPLLERILCLAQTAEVFHAAGGIDATRAIAVRRRGRWFDPALVEALLAVCRDRPFWETLERLDVSGWEPADRLLRADESRLDRIAEAFARVIDAKSPFTARHSERVAEVAVGIADVLGLGRERGRDLRRAALLHDVGKLAISNLILDKPGMLTEAEFAQVKTHPAHTLEILRRAPCFLPIAALAANHHERVDGSGYPRGLGGDQLAVSMRVLAIADVYEALTADRPYRAAMPAERALAIIRAETPGKLDAGALAALEIHLARVSDPLAAGVLTLSAAPGVAEPARVSGVRARDR
jgi:HD-GYP domain-containing protein (c-di-GMP phosphodiesterase class II)